MTTVDVVTRKRLITVVAVPYDEPGIVEVRGEVWTELFDRHAFDGIDRIRRTVRVNRHHERDRAVGKVVAFRPQDPRGLIADIRIAETALGDETLQLAAEDILGASIGYAAKPADVIHDRSKMTRRVMRAHVDHIALTSSPTFEGARVVEVRSALDEFVNDPVLAWAKTYGERRIERRVEASIRARRAARRNARELRQAVDEYLAEPVSAPARYNFGGSWGRWASQIRPS